LGRAGELKAAEFLEKKGFKIIKTNYKTHLGEIDIIAEDNGAVVFVEVKTRSGDGYGAPSEAVDYKKRQKYFRVATEYLSREGKTDRVCRFDVVEIEKGEINHIFDAFSM
jgi:putative endonuclease